LIRKDVDGRQATISLTTPTGERRGAEGKARRTSRSN